ncbi:MAG: nitroreductase family protein [Betaproteobacteria bacterium]|nr:nitroreductase family protein [Betaproteobacteria bacterium]
MKVTEAIESRRATKAFDPDHRMAPTDVDRLLSLAMRAPTAFNIQNWRFVVVRDPQLRRDLRSAAWDQPQVTDASLLLVLCADLKAWEKHPARYWRNAAPTVQEFVVTAIDRYYRDKETVQRDEAMRSCGLAAMTLMLAAKEMGYDSCPMDGFDFEAVARLLRLPEDHAIGLMVAIGKGIREPWPRSGPIAQEDAVIYDRFEA